MSTHPYGSSLSDLSVEDKQDVELAQLLLAAAEKVGNQQLERAMRLLENCQWISSNVGTPVQRTVFYFSEALRERINNKKGCSNDKSQHFDACIKRDVNAFSAMHQKLPFFQVIHLTAAQTILENINNEAIIHLIDFNILTGLHWAAFMQAFSEQKRDQNSYLKITSIETEDKTRAEKTGNLLKTFASNLNLSFNYNLIFLSDIKDLKQDDLGIEPEEVVAVLFPFVLRKKIKPSIIVVTEIDANLNSPSFFTRFIDTLFYYGALFDSLEESMAGDDKNRKVVEAGTYRKGIHDIVATEGYQRLSRSVTINVWRAFFTRFGMQELEISPDSLHQACLIVNQYPSGKSCTLDKDQILDQSLLLEMITTQALSNLKNSIMQNSGKSTPIIEKQSQISADLGDIDSFCRKYGFYPDQTNQEEASNEQIQHFQNGPECLFFQDSSDPLKTFENVNRASMIHMNSNRNHEQLTQKLSTEQILKLAGERFVQFSSQESMLTHPYGSPLSDISVENKQDVELAQLLLVAAEKVGNQQLERAMRLLENCQWISSNVGTPVQRVVFYFSEALRERINNEKGSLNNKPELIDACVKRNFDALMAMHKTLPFGEVLHFTAAQTILENIKNGTKVHLIDFNILTGLRWAAFMQAFTAQKRGQNSYLRITAIETENKVGAEKTGNMLKGFASHLNLSFSYNLLFLSDIKDLKLDDMGIEPEGTVAILFPFILKTLISKPVYLKNLMAMTKKIKPAIIFTTEVEANLNSPSFFTRFTDTLHYYGALFDSLEESMARDDGNRMVIEAGTFRKGIHNFIATEGHQRLSRCVTINVWRAFLTRSGMQELELSTASLYQARLIVNKFPSGNSCTLGISKKGLLLGWKGTPLFSLSAWNFH